MAVAEAYVYPSCISHTSTKKQLSFQGHHLFFSRASEVRREKKNVWLNRVSNSLPPGLESDTLTTRMYVNMIQFQTGDSMV